LAAVKADVLRSGVARNQEIFEMRVTKVLAAEAGAVFLGRAPCFGSHSSSGFIPPRAENTDTLLVALWRMGGSAFVISHVRQLHLI
jgi:hypothetical protein